MKSNYGAWDINKVVFQDLKTDEEKIRFLLGFAILAPSSHNTQPWVFSVSTNKVNILLEPTRLLAASDENDRQAYLSIGCALENLSIAAEYFGYLVTQSLFPESGVVASLSFVSSSSTHTGNDQLIQSVLNRVTNRNKYSVTGDLPSGLLKKIKLLESTGAKIFLVTEKQEKEKIADIAVAASVEAMDDRGFRQELSRYVRSNLTNSKTGMPAFGFGIPTPVSLIFPKLIKYFNLNRLAQRQDKDLLANHTQALVVIATEGDTADDWIAVGQLYQKIALFATSSGLSTAMWAAPIQIGEHYLALKNFFGTNLRPQALFRLGYATKKPPHSPRIPVAEVTK